MPCMAYCVQKPQVATYKKSGLITCWIKDRGGHQLGKKGGEQNDNDIS